MAKWQPGQVQGRGTGVPCASMPPPILSRQKMAKWQPGQVQDIGTGVPSASMLPPILSRQKMAKRLIVIWEKKERKTSRKWGFG